MKFIAEVGSNHNGSYERALDLVTAASAAGFDAVKFQLFRGSKLFRDPLKQAEVFDRELPVVWLGGLQERAARLGLKFGCSAFHLAGAKALSDRHVDFLKISSYSLLDLDFIRQSAGLGLPILMSTGMATEQEIEAAVGAVIEGSGGHQMPRLMHCVSVYKTAAKDANLAAIETIRERYGTCGWSDHTADAVVVLRAAWYWNAIPIELHVDLDDGAGCEPGRHVWLMRDASALIDRIERGNLSDGDGVKEPQPSELIERLWRADPSDGLRPLR